MAGAQLRLLLAGCDADIVIGGHTHVPADRVIDGIRALNPGSAGMPRICGAASWLLLDDDNGVAVTHKTTPFDVDAVVGDLRQRCHPNAEFVGSVLTGQRQQI